MHFGLLHCFYFHPKPQRISFNPKSSKSMATSSSSYQQLASTFSGSTSSQMGNQSYKEPQRTLLTLFKQLEVLCESMVDFDSLAANGFDLRPTVNFQGWVKYFDRLIGPVFPHLVKEFWIHAHVYPKVILSSVLSWEKHQDGSSSHLVCSSMESCEGIQRNCQNQASKDQGLDSYGKINL